MTSAITDIWITHGVISVYFPPIIRGYRCYFKIEILILLNIFLQEGKFVLPRREAVAAVTTSLRTPTTASGAVDWVQLHQQPPQTSRITPLSWFPGLRGGDDASACLTGLRLKDETAIQWARGYFDTCLFKSRKTSGGSTFLELVQRIFFRLVSPYFG